MGNNLSEDDPSKRMKERELNLQHSQDGPKRQYLYGLTISSILRNYGDLFYPDQQTKITFDQFTCLFWMRGIVPRSFVSGDVVDIEYYKIWTRFGDTFWITYMCKQIKEKLV